MAPEHDYLRGVLEELHRKVDAYHAENRDDHRDFYRRLEATETHPAHGLSREQVRVVERLVTIFEGLESRCAMTTLKVVMSVAAMIAVLHIDDLTVWVKRLLLRH